MKPHLFASLILVIFLILPLNAVQYDAPAVYAVDGNINTYAERYLKFENWRKLSSDKKKMVIAGYLQFLKTDNLDRIPTGDQQAARKILRNTTPDELLDYVNNSYIYSKRTSGASRSDVDTVILQYLQKRMETEKNYKDLLMVARQVSMVKNADIKDGPRRSIYDVLEYPSKDNNVFEIPKYFFSHELWQMQDQNEKKALVTGYMAFLSILIKKEFCLNEEEKRRYDLFCKMVTINELVNHVDKLFEDPLYRNEGVQMLIYRYMTYNFQNYIGDPMMLPA